MLRSVDYGGVATPLRTLTGTPARSSRKASAAAAVDTAWAPERASLLADLSAAHRANALYAEREAMLRAREDEFRQNTIRERTALSTALAMAKAEALELRMVASRVALAEREIDALRSRCAAAEARADDAERSARDALRRLRSILDTQTQAPPASHTRERHAMRADASDKSTVRNIESQRAAASRAADRVHARSSRPATTMASLPKSVRAKEPMSIKAEAILQRLLAAMEDGGQHPESMPAEKIDGRVRVTSVQMRQRAIVSGDVPASASDAPNRVKSKETSSTSPSEMPSVPAWMSHLVDADGKIAPPRALPLPVNRVEDGGMKSYGL